MKRNALFLAAALGMSSGMANAGGLDLSLETQLTAAGAQAQQSFNEISAAFTPIVAYRSVKSPRPMGGLVGFDMSVDVSMTDAAAVNSALAGLSTVGGGTAQTIDGTLPTLKAHGHLSLPFGLGASYFTFPEVDGISFSGYELQYAFIDGEIGFIANATYTLSASYNSTSFSLEEVMEIDTTGYDLKAAIGFDMPLFEANVYTGVGQVDGDATSLVPNVTLNSNSVSESKSFIGAEMKLGFFVFGAEMDTIGGSSTNSVKFGIGFGF